MEYQLLIEEYHSQKQIYASGFRLLAVHPLARKRELVNF